MEKSWKTFSNLEVILQISSESAEVNKYKRNNNL